jgi:hypothetical protein
MHTDNHGRLDYSKSYKEYMANKKHYIKHELKQQQGSNSSSKHIKPFGLGEFEGKGKGGIVSVVFIYCIK